MIKNSLLFTGLACLIGCQGVDAEVDEQHLTSPTCDYPQVFGNASHTGVPCPEVTNMQVVKTIVQDPDADAENEFSGFLQIHESPPLTFGDFVIVPSKDGFVDGFDRSPERYLVQAFRWSPSVAAPGATLEPAWTASTDWQPVDGVIQSFGFVTNGYVQQFAPAISGGSLYMPARHGKLLRLSLATGAVQATINPFAGTPFNNDERTIVNNALSVDGIGNVYYTAVSWQLDNNPSSAPRASHLIQVAPTNDVRLTNFAAIASTGVGVPGPNDPCEYPFGTGGTPAATGPESKAPIFGCGVQRPAINSAVAVDPATGHLVLFSYANNAQGAAFLIEVNPTTMTPIRASDTRGHLLHGCGRRLSIASAACGTITANGTVNIGHDPAFNGPVRFRGIDLIDSSPTIAPNGDRSIGSYDGGFTFGGNFDSRGAGVVFDRNGAFVAKNEQFWWEVTPSVWEHDGGFSYLQDRNLYSAFELSVAQFGPGQALEVANQIPLSFDPVAIDFVDAHIVFGPGGDRYVVNGDGHLYKFVPGVKEPVDAVELQNADGSIRSMSALSGYFARDRKGRVYASYAGNVYVIDSGAPPAAPRVQRALTSETRAKVLSGQQAKAESIAQTALPEPPETADEQARIVDAVAAIAMVPTTGIGRRPNDAKRAGLDALLGGPVTQACMPPRDGGSPPPGCCTQEGFLVCCCYEVPGGAMQCGCIQTSFPAPNNPPSAP